MAFSRLNSISAQIKRSVRTIAVLLAIPVVIGLIVTTVYAAQYQGMIGRMEDAAQLKPVVETQIAEELFSVAAGRISFENSSVEKKVRSVNGTLDRLLSETGGEGRLQLTVARRTMDTMEQYVLRTGEGMRTGIPIQQIEEIVDEVRDVGRLVADMLDNFIYEEISNVSSASVALRRFLVIAAIIEIFLTAGALVYSSRSSENVTNEIHTAISSMEETVRRIAEGNFRDRVTGVKIAELEELAEQINQTANQLETLIRETKEKTDHLAKAELRTMQAQISPHFLYNTLDTIVWQAESGKADEVVRLTRSLSDFFRISLSSGADWIPVPQELKHVSAYLSIQKIRYRDILDYEVDECEELKNVYMPKLLLQPLVENALYHGIKTKRGGGKIDVHVQTGYGILTILVKDNGKGMTEEELASAQALLQEENPTVQKAMEPGHSGFGLRNVDMRIRLYYHKKKGLMLKSGPEGTEVSFTIPIRTREEIE